MDGNEKIRITDVDITDKRSTIMHSGEKDLMKKLGELGTQNGGDILEIGFGLHLSADAVQSNPNVTSHTIIEVHPEIYQRALDWAKDKPNTKILLGDWVDVIPTLTTKFDGIIHDTHYEDNFSSLLDVISNVCKENTIVAFFEYPMYDHRINGLRVAIDEKDLEQLPYKDNGGFKFNQFELKYTTFDGNKFYVKKDIKHLL